MFQFNGFTIEVTHYLPVIPATFHDPAEGGEIEFNAYDSDGNEIFEELDHDEIFSAYERYRESEEFRC